MKFSINSKIKFLFITICIVWSGACASTRLDSAPSMPSIIITKFPPADKGGPGKTAEIKGTVSGARPEHKIILYAYNGVWWIQPFVKKPFTEIQTDSTWKNLTHLGTRYAAILVEPDYLPPPKTSQLPELGNGVVAVSVVDGVPDPSATPEPAAKTLSFSGYEWTVHNRTGNRGGTINVFEPENVWIDEKGFLHLRVTNKNGQWTSAEINLTRSLGYGTYRIIVQDTSSMDPAAVLSMFTWDDQGEKMNRREMNLDISRWGDPANKNLHYVVQPYYLPANVFRSEAPAGSLMHSLRWEPGKAAFQSTQVGKTNNKTKTVSEYDFMSGIPTPKTERLHLNLYIFGYSKVPLQKETEVVIEKFEYFP